MTYDVIVLGTGGVGSAALYHLARRGVKVLGLDRFPAGHNKGSSHGGTRAIRQAYFEHPDYVPLLLRSYELWEELQQETGEQLFHKVGLLEAGPADGILVPGVLQAAREHNLAVEELTPAQAAGRFPGFQLPAESAIVFEQEAGYLLVEPCVEAHCQLAIAHGAEHITDAAITGWQAEGDHFTVTTEDETYQAGRLVITAGAWAGELCAELGVPLTVLAKHLHWYANDDPVYRQERGCPVFFFETPAGFFYGFPQTGRQGVKVAEHSGGTPIEDPLTYPRVVDPIDRGRIEGFLADYLPAVSAQARKHCVCFYTMSPDDHFLLGPHPAHEHVYLAAGLSGHGFKMTSVLGETLAQLATDEPPSPATAFLSPQRFATP